MTNATADLRALAYPLRDGLPPLPPRIASLPVSDKGYPVPFFVAYVDGKPDFRVADPTALQLAVTFGRCWICGQGLGAWRAFVTGPMCTVTRTSAEPPSHRDCAVFAATACPFLILPKAVRRDANLPSEAEDPPGVFITRNPGVAAVWITKTFKVYRVDGGLLFRFGDPDSVAWYCEGRTATRDEVLASLHSGLPVLEASADLQGANAALDDAFNSALAYIPI